MASRLLAASFGIVAVIGLASVETRAQERTESARTVREGSAGADAKAAPKVRSAPKAKAKAKAKSQAKAKTERATFAAGCFWSTEAVFERVPGVKSVVSGFAGGNVSRPSYEMVSTGETGHAEAVQVEYDPAVVSYDKLLNVFWSAHDPTTLNSQGDDFGTQYRSVIFYHTGAQKEAALKSYQDLTSRRVFLAPIVTDLVPFTRFYPAESYHQNYYRRNRNSHYSQFYIVPKLKKLELK